MTDDSHLWNIVKRRVHPLGAGREPSRRIDPIERPSPHEIDLHGETIHGAYLATEAFVEAARQRGGTKVTIITGQGEIAKEIPRWFEGRGKLESLRGGGAFKLKLPKA